MCVILMAQGGQTRWRREENLLQQSKHLLDVGGEPLLARTIRMLYELTTQDVILIGPREYRGCGATTITLDDPGPLLSGIIQAGDRFNELEMIFLLGDVLFSYAALRAVLSPRDGVMFFGRTEPSTVSAKTAHELFGFRYNQWDWYTIRGYCSWMTYRGANIRYPPKLWALYRLYSGFDHDEYEINPDTICEINDYTDDCDSYDEYQVFWKPMLAAALADKE